MKQWIRSTLRYLRCALVGETVEEIEEALARDAAADAVCRAASEMRLMAIRGDGGPLIREFHVSRADGERLQAAVEQWKKVT